MRNLAISEFLSLDGVMQSPGGPNEDPTGGFKLGGWIFGYWDDAMGKKLEEGSSRPFDLLLGRKTYEIFAAHWPYVTADARQARGEALTGDEPMADKLNAARKHVASRTLKRVDWNNSTLLEGDATEAVRKLKAQHGPDLLVYGSANLVQTLIKHGLVDEFRLMIFPVVLGPGKRLFADGAAPAGLELVSSSTSTTGVVMATYKPGGEVKAGAIGPDSPSPAELERRRKLQ